MGSLHLGHLNLIKSANVNNDITICSIFVNPLHFGPNEDLLSYPRYLNNDISKLKTVDCDYIFAPSVDEMYNKDHNTFVDMNTENSIESKLRPGHFRGVATVVAKLFNIIQPTSAYFGQKDAMQCIVIKRLVNDLSIPVKLYIEPTIREKDGLAMSSRNVYLSKEDREIAPILSKSLFTASQLFNNGERDIEKIKTVVNNLLTTKPLTVQYVSVCDGESGQELTSGNWPETGVLSIACKVGKTRLIDNIPLPTPAGHEIIIGRL